MYEQRKVKSDKLLQELRQVKVRNVIMIYRFSELMDVNDENVKKLKKHVKKSKKANKKGEKVEPFVP